MRLRTAVVLLYCIVSEASELTVLDSQCGFSDNGSDVCTTECTLERTVHRGYIQPGSFYNPPLVLTEQSLKLLHRANESCYTLMVRGMPDQRYAISSIHIRFYECSGTGSLDKFSNHEFFQATLRKTVSEVDDIARLQFAICGFAPVPESGSDPCWMRVIPRPGHNMTDIHRSQIYNSADPDGWHDTCVPRPNHSGYGSYSLDNILLLILIVSPFILSAIAVALHSICNRLETESIIIWVSNTTRRRLFNSDSISEWNINIRYSSTPRTSTMMMINSEDSDGNYRQSSSEMSSGCFHPSQPTQSIWLFTNATDAEH